MRVLVTGGHGFIGSHVLRRLVERGHRVACLDVAGASAVAEPVADEVSFHRGDVTDPIDVHGAVAAADPDRIVHLAALLGRESQRRPRDAIEVNLTGTVTVLEAADALGVERVVAASSASSYGEVGAEVDRLDETVVQRPSNVYGLTKYAVERVGRTYADRRGLEFAAIQPVHGLGPDRERGNVEDAFVIKAAVSGTPVTVPRIEHPFEVIYVEDEARAFVDAALADALPHDTYLIGTGERTTLVGVVETVRGLVSGADLTVGAKRGDDQFLRRPPSDPARIRADLGWEPTHTVEESIEAYVTWLEANPDAWSFDPEAAPWPGATDG